MLQAEMVRPEIDEVGSWCKRREQWVFYKNLAI